MKLNDEDDSKWGSFLTEVHTTWTKTPRCHPLYLVNFSKSAVLIQLVI